MGQPYLRPLGRRVVVERAEADKTLGVSGLLQAADTHVEAPCEGTVIAIGPDVTGIAVGDVVLFAKYSGIDGPYVDPQRGIIILEGDEVAAVIDKAEYRRQVEELRAAYLSREENAGGALAALRERMVAQERGS